MIEFLNLESHLMYMLSPDRQRLRARCFHMLVAEILSSLERWRMRLLYIAEATIFHSFEDHSIVSMAYKIDFRHILKKELATADVVLAGSKHVMDAIVLLLLIDSMRSRTVTFG